MGVKIPALASHCRLRGDGEGGAGGRRRRAMSCVVGWGLGGQSALSSPQHRCQGADFLRSSFGIFVERQACSGNRGALTYLSPRSPEAYQSLLTEGARMEQSWSRVEVHHASVTHTMHSKRIYSNCQTKTSQYLRYKANQNLKHIY